MPKGNPCPSPKTRFATEGSESLNQKLTIMLSTSMMESIRAMPDKNDFVRVAIAEKLAKSINKS